MYTKSRNKVKSLLRKAKRNYEKDIASRSRTSPKVFWSHVRGKLKSKTGVAPLLSDDTDKDTLKFTDKEKAEILQRQFTSVFTREPDGDLPAFGKRIDTVITDFNITEIKVKEKIISLDISKACGPDEIHPRFLKELANEVSEPLATIFNKSLKEEVVPAEWKNAHVSPMFKKGSKNLASNYRPISLTSIVCKIMESLVKDVIMDHLKKNKLFTKHQFGFIPGRSTVTQLLSFLSGCIETISKGHVVDSIYFDFAKAFDTVPHRRMIHKLMAYGIEGKIVPWIKAFLSERKQLVKVNGIESLPSVVISGIPKEVFLALSYF